MAKLSVFIIAVNEETRIERAINSVKKMADEIIVIDSGSKDNTVELSQNLGAKVVYNAWPGYTEQKAYGESLCKNDWILNIDADEEISMELQDEIDHIFSEQQQDKYFAYKIKVTIMHRSDLRPRTFAPYNNVVRLYNKKYAGFRGKRSSSTHDSVIFEPNLDTKNKIIDLKARAYHRSGTSIEQLVAKANSYSSQQAIEMIRIGRVPSKFRIGSEILLWFFKAFFIRRYFIFGFDGFVDSIIFAFARFIRLAKARERAIELSLESKNH